MKLLLWRVIVTPIVLPKLALDADNAKPEARGIVSSVTVALAVMLVYFVPLIVALRLNVAEMVTLRVPLSLCETVFDALPSSVVLPPPLLIAGDVIALEVPSMVNVFDLVPMLSDQPESCTRYKSAVIVDVFADMFCVALHDMRKV